MRKYVVGSFKINSKNKSSKKKLQWHNYVIELKEKKRISDQKNHSSIQNAKIINMETSFEKLVSQFDQKIINKNNKSK